MSIKDKMPKFGDRVSFEENGCFVCGPANPIGLHLEFEYDKENFRSKSSVVFEKQHQGWDGVVHGGILSAVMDDSMAHAILAAGKLGITTRMNVEFKSFLRVGEKLYLDGEITRMGSRLAETKSVGYTLDENSERVIKCSATGTFYLDSSLERG